MEPHEVPSGTRPLTQTGWPLAQETVAVWQRSRGTQVMLAAQATQVPWLQNWLGPQLVPSGSTPVSLHEVTLPTQVVRPMWHAAFGVQDTPGVQEPQVPSVHVSPFPHAVPSASAAPCTQTGWPVAHEVVPTWHRSAGTQELPAVHAAQTPWLQT